MNSIYNTLFEMMNDRGFSAEKSIKTNIEIIDFDITFENKNSKYLICYINNDKVGINHIKAVIEKLESENCKNVIIIHSLIVTSFAKQFLESSEYNIEMFHENELLKNITKHYLVPKHKLLDKEDIKKLLRQLQIKSCHLPKVKKSDPISRYYGAKENDVFEITRFDDNIKSQYYRKVY